MQVIPLNHTQNLRRMNGGGGCVLSRSIHICGKRYVSSCLMCLVLLCLLKSVHNLFLFIFFPFYIRLECTFMFSDLFYNGLIYTFI